MPVTIICSPNWPGSVLKFLGKASSHSRERMLSCRFDFGRAATDRQPIGWQIRTRIGPSLAITTPSMLLGLAIGVILSMLVAFCRGTYLDTGAAVLCVLLMSISVLYYVTLAKFLWFLLLPWLVYVCFWLGTIMGTYALGFLQALLGAVGMAVLSWLVEAAFGVKTFRKS